MSVRGLLIGALRLYRRLVSPWLPRACRFHPSCSVYAMDAIELHGAGRGTLLALWRLLRCQPFSKGGFDPVPAPGRDKANDSWKSVL